MLVTQADPNVASQRLFGPLFSSFPHHIASVLLSTDEKARRRQLKQAIRIVETCFTDLADWSVRPSLLILSCLTTGSRNLLAARPVFMGLSLRVPNTVKMDGCCRGGGGSAAEEEGGRGRRAYHGPDISFMRDRSEKAAAALAPI